MASKLGYFAENVQLLPDVNFGSAVGGIVILWTLGLCLPVFPRNRIVCKSREGVMVSPEYRRGMSTLHSSA